MDPDQRQRTAATSGGAHRREPLTSIMEATTEDEAMTESDAAMVEAMTGMSTDWMRSGGTRMRRDTTTSGTTTTGSTTASSDDNYLRPYSTTSSPTWFPISSPVSSRRPSPVSSRKPSGESQPPEDTDRASKRCETEKSHGLEPVSAPDAVQKGPAPWELGSSLFTVKVARPEDSDEPTPLPPKIETSVEFIDDYIEEDWEKAYELGTFITLTPHKPSNPFGAPAFPRPANVNIADMGFDDRYDERSRTEHALYHLPPPYTPMTREQRKEAGIPPCWPTKSSLTSSENGKPVTVKLLKLLAGGPWLGPATFLCEVQHDHYLSLSRPYKLPKHVVAKFQDPLFFEDEPPLEQGPFNEFGRANINFSRETAAYEHLREKGYHGVPDKPQKDSRVRAHIAPRYYGAFIAEINCYNPGLKGEAKFLTRSVGVILLEHIDGRSILDLNKHGTLDVSKEARLDILKIFIDGYVRQLHAGVTHEPVAPENIIVAPSKGRTPRVALLHYRESIVDSKRKKPLRPWGSLDNPPHPYDVFKNRYDLLRLTGWFPPEWMDKDNKAFEDWLINTFDDDSYGPYHPRKIRTSTPGGPAVSTPDPAPEPHHPSAGTALPTKKRKESSTGILGFFTLPKWLGSSAAVDSDGEEMEKESLAGSKKRRKEEEGASKDDAGRN